MDNERFETKVEVDTVYAKLFAKEAAPFVFTTTALMLTQVVVLSLSDLLQLSSLLSYPLLL